MEILYIFIGLIIGFAAAWVLKSLLLSSQKKLEIQKMVSDFELDKEKLKSEFAIEKSKWEALIAGEQDKLNLQKQEVEEIRKKFTVEFENIANRIFDEKSSKFTRLNHDNLSSLLKPLGDNIESFKKKVEETYDKESKQRFSLEEKIKDLVLQTDKVSQEANNLASALKGDSKKQGDWGEVVLENILQASGLRKNYEFFMQENIKDDEGNNLRPDVLVKLPDERVIIVDSKVSLRSYERFYNADNEEEQKRNLKDHLNAIYAHINLLQSKKYDNLSTSLDFVMMFIPIEPAYLLAVQHDPDLWSYAYSKRILLISPTNLIACLKLIEDLWKRDMQTKQIKDIVDRGEKMYEKFVGFVETLDKLGKQLNDVQKTYAQSVNQLTTGSGNLIGQAQKLRSLGLKSSKELPPAMVKEDPEEEIND